MSDALAMAVAQLELQPDVAARLERFLTLLLDRNVALNLTGAKDVASLLDHVRDSLTLAPYIREPHVDVGSGGGFPALPLAIVSGFRMTLVESVVKKARFLEEVVQLLDLTVTVRATRAEEAARASGLRETFASATARAVASVTTVLELTIPFLALGGLAVLQRGGLTPEERSAAVDAALVLGAVVENEITVGPGRGRSLLLVRKTAPTGTRFPRRAGIPAKRPLCWHGSDA